MDVRELRRNALDGWLKAVRFPIDTATRLLPNGDQGPRNAAMLVIEQNLAMATALANRQLVMVAGRIFAETTAAELANDPEAQRRWLGVEHA